MDKKMNNEELQSRREFFKKAAKAALPVVAAALFAGVPSVSHALESSPSSDCRYDVCSGSCYHGCKGGCSSTCGGGCKGGCYHSCSAACGRNCKGGNFGR